MSQSPQIGSMFLTKVIIEPEPVAEPSQSPQIGSMFLTKQGINDFQFIIILSQSPQIGSMFLTWNLNLHLQWNLTLLSRNPLKSGQCFLPRTGEESDVSVTFGSRRNPLKSGQCFLHHSERDGQERNRKKEVAIPSNRVNVSYKSYDAVWLKRKKSSESQSPQIGSMFLTRKKIKELLGSLGSRNPLKSGQCFLRRN